MVAVRVTPRSSRDAIEGANTAGELRVRVTAAPTEGAANAALTRLLAQELGVPKGAVSVVLGATSRHKRLAIERVDPAELRERWPGVDIKAR